MCGRNRRFEGESCRILFFLRRTRATPGYDAQPRRMHSGWSASVAGTSVESRGGASPRVVDTRGFYDFCGGFIAKN